MTKEAFERGITEIKADKKSINGIDSYELKKVVDYDKNKKFINDFIKRNEKDNKSKPYTSFKPLPKTEAKPINNNNSNNTNSNNSNNNIASPFRGLVEDSRKNQPSSNNSSSNNNMRIP